MQVYGLNNYGEIVRPLQCINVQWGARYYEIGTFQIQLRAQDWDTSLCYITMENRKQTGLIEKIELQCTVKGDFVLASGRFLEYVLNWRHMPAYKKTDTVWVVVNDIMANYPGIEIPPSWLPSLPTDTISVETVGGEPIGDTLYQALKMAECAPEVGVDEAGKYHLYLRKGADKSSTVCFGPSSGTALEMTATVDSSAYRNFARVFYSDGTNKVEYDVDQTLFGDYRYLPQGYNRNPPRRDLYMDTGKTKAAGQTQEAFEAELSALAASELKNNPYYTCAEANISDSQYVYRTDYDLGDKVGVEATAITPFLTTRIVGVDEVWKNNEHTITPTFGDMLPVVSYR